MNKGTIYAVTEIEAHYIKVPVFVVGVNKLYGGEYTEQTFKLSFL